MKFPEELIVTATCPDCGDALEFRVKAAMRSVAEPSDETGYPNLRTFLEWEVVGDVNTVLAEHLGECLARESTESDPVVQ